MRRIATQLMASVTLLLTLLFSQNSFAQQPSAVSLPGSFGSELGCLPSTAYPTGDWDPACPFIQLTPVGWDLWEGTFTIPAGNWEYKVAYDNDWKTNYGLGGTWGGANIPLNLYEPSTVRFSYSTWTHMVTVTLIKPTVVIAGDFQNEISWCGDWDPKCEATRLTYDATSMLWYGIFYIPKGDDWQYKATINNSWNESYGLGGDPNGGNIHFSTSGDKKTLFRYNPQTHISTANVIDYNIVLMGDFQEAFGCWDNWQPDCPATGLTFDPAHNLWTRTLHLMDGTWNFKVAVDGSGGKVYGEGGVLNGENITLNLSFPSTVHFTYDPETHVVTYKVDPDTVVIPGNFQNELGCPGDWMPDCDNSRLAYNAESNVWTGTYSIPAGSWEYKVALNNSWDENYGEGGAPFGDNMHLNLAKPATITFIYNPQSHLVTLVYDKADLCFTAFYDANANGNKDWGEDLPLEGITFNLSGKTVASQYSGSDGKACFIDLPTGRYIIEAIAPGGYLSTLDSQIIDFTKPANLNYGMVCLGGAGAKSISFWMNRQGKAVLDGLQPWQQGYMLQDLRYFYNLRNADGSDFDPKDFNELRDWLQHANSKNMAYKLSAQMVTLYLNMATGMIDYSRMVYTPGITYWGWQRDFAEVYTLIQYVNQQLFDNSFGGDEVRAYHESLRKMLEDANADKTFVQLQPCGSTLVTATQREVVEGVAGIGTSAVIWPNPSGAYFNLRPSVNGKDGEVLVRVLDVDGRLVYTTRGSAAKEYRFGEGFKPGLYVVEIIQGDSRSTIKVVKQ